MNSTALWVLDAIVALGMIGAAIAMVAVGRTLRRLSSRVSEAMADLQKQAADLSSEAVSLMRSTQSTQRHVEQLTDRLSHLTSSTDTVVRVLPAVASDRNRGTLSGIVGTMARAVAVAKFMKSIFPRRKR